MFNTSREDTKYRKDNYDSHRCTDSWLHILLELLEKGHVYWMRWEGFIKNKDNVVHERRL